jgi:glycolate oxidase FAD binding subunit
MSSVLRPESAAQVAELVAWAVAEQAPLEIVGRGSKRGLGRPVQAAHDLDLSALTGITLYEAEELVLAARVGTPLIEIEETLAQHNQHLAFEPPDLGPLLGNEADDASIGGMLACNLSGPRRLKSGAARDHFLGVEAVSGRGEAFKSGGRVVKNVTGYDLCKLLAGSYGTLAVMTDVTVKVLPRPEKARTVLIFGQDDSQALTVMTQALNSQHEVTGAAHLPAGLAAGSTVSYVADAGASGQSVTALRLEGPGPSVTSGCGPLFAPPRLPGVAPFRTAAFGSGGRRPHRRGYRRWNRWWPEPALLLRLGRRLDLVGPATMGGTGRCGPSLRAGRLWRPRNPGARAR